VSHCGSTRALERSELVFSFDMPPSMNKLYVRRRGGGVALSDAAHRYREHVKKTVAKSLAQVSQFPAEDREIIFSVDIEAQFQGLELPGWFERYTRGKNTGERKAKSRYKRVDADNRIKFAQDCLIKSLGIPDDAQVFEVSVKKMNTVHAERIIMSIRTEPWWKYFGGEHAKES
jgi:Holliday junction resolvase RusA-like endonuclease